MPLASCCRGAALLLLLLLFGACGKVGPPQPPFVRIPEAVKDLTATQSGYDIVLTWTNPPHNIDGSVATNLANALIRSNEATVATVSVNGPGKGQSYVIPVAPAALNASRTFRVTVDTKQGKLSQASNAVSITPVEVPGRVTHLSAVADQRHITLGWDKPQEHPELADAYIVTRADLPLEAETVSEPHYEDPQYQPGKTFTYNVTPIRRVSGMTITGIGPEPITIKVQDTTPPHFPTGLDIKLSDNGAVLTWDANEEADLAGYRVFRSDRPDGGFTPVSDRLIMTNLFSESTYRPGVYYAVSAVDDSGNESPRSAPLRGP